MPSYVIVWENNTFGHKKVSGFNWPGHACMNIGKNFHKDVNVDPAVNSYVSWFPLEGQASFNLKGLIKDIFKPKEGFEHRTLEQDSRFERYLPDHVIKMESSEEQENRMRAEWNGIIRVGRNSSYKSLRKNCSTIVARVLHAGGYYAQKWAVDTNFAWTPANVAKLARKAGGTPMLWEDFRDVLLESDIFTGTWPEFARSGRFCTTGAPVRYQQDG